jgi:hypothetical protein
MATIVSKMSVKTLKANPALAKAENKRVFLCRIVGIAGGLVTKVDTRGEPITGITGNFRGKNVVTHEEYESGVLYLPGGIQEMLENAVNKGELDKNDKPIYEAVEFALDIYSVPASNPIGYSYEAEPVFKAKEADPLSELMAKAEEARNLPALEAAKDDKKK